MFWMLDLGPQHQKSKYTKIWIVGQKAKKNFSGIDIQCCWAFNLGNYSS